MSLTLILPTQLFENNDLISLNNHIILYEHPVYFTKFKFHKLKLILHRSSMKKYKDDVYKKYKKNITYLDFNYNLDQYLKENKINNINMYDPVDFTVIQDLKTICKKHNIQLSVHETLSFLCTLDDLTQYHNNNKSFKQLPFYIWQRTRLNILMNSNKPIGGKWTYDKFNRDNYPKDYVFKENIKFNINKYSLEAEAYINKHFKDNVGETNLYVPIDHKSAKKHLSKFLKNKFNCFSKYQDAIHNKITFGCHSVLSPLLNIGLLVPNYIVNQILKYYNKYNKLDLLFTTEALLRQIISWRELCRFTYVFNHKELISGNYFNHTRKLDAYWYGNKEENKEEKKENLKENLKENYNNNKILKPIQDVITKVTKYAYAHHIERLMIAGNFMLLNQIHPKEVYKWFMIFFIDSYEWVMEPNVYAMSQYSTSSMSSLLVTRPYFSSSNYILKMSNYKKEDWVITWDALYYNFINDNIKIFSKIYSIASIVSYWNKKTKKEQNKIIQIANTYLK